MKEIIVSKNEAGQRFDKLLGKILNEAPKSFIYKMLRKKNITLNDKKADGSEKVELSDRVKFYLSDETFDKFSTTFAKQSAQILKVHSEVGSRIGIIYEDENVLILNKPTGLLSQKAQPEDISVVEHVISYMLANNQITKTELDTFKPSICNRLDRNTSGLIVAGKTLIGLQTMAQAFKERSLHKYYRCIVKGKITKKNRISGYLYKDESTLKVQILNEKCHGASQIETEYEPIMWTEDYTLLSVKLITGKTHQIRAHLNSIGHPIIGDGKYGNRTTNEYFKKNFSLNYQLLHAYELEFPVIEHELSNLSERKFVAELPKKFSQIQSALFSK